MVAAMVLGFVTESDAWGRRPGFGPHGSKKMMKRIVSKLELNEQQKKIFKLAHEEMRAEMEVNRKKIKALHQKFAAELKKEKPNRDKIHKYVRQIGRLQTEMKLKRMDNVLELQKTLTPKQRKLHNEMMEKAKKQMHKRYRNKSCR